jgi:hypothetical protein
VIPDNHRRSNLSGDRDPNVFGGCPASSTVNATKTGRVDWMRFCAQVGFEPPQRNLRNQE